MIFQRDWFIKKTADIVLTKHESEFRSCYWRVPLGSGKTVFLKLMGRESQSRGCDVYMLTSATELDRFPLDLFHELAKEAGSKTVV